MTTAQKPKMQLQWVISTAIVLLTYGVGFVYDRGVKAQQMIQIVDTTKKIDDRIDKCENTDNKIMECIKEDKKEQAQTNKDLVDALTDLKMAIVELRTEIKAAR